MHIALVTAQPPELDEHGRQVTALADTLADHGHDPMIYAPCEGDRSDMTAATAADLVPLRDLTAASMTAEYGAALEQRWLSQPPEVAHAFGCQAGLAVASATETTHDLAMVQDHRPGADTSVFETGGDERWARLETALGRHAEHTIVADSHQADALAHRGVRRQSMSVVPYVVDMQRYSPDGPREPHADVFRLVCAPDCTVADLQTQLTVLARIPDAELLITGASALDASELESLRTQARTTGVDGRMQVLGELDDTELATLYRSADLVVSGSSRAVAGSACLEAMASGAAVVASTPDGTDDLVLDGINGRLVPSGQVELVTRAVRDLLAQPARRSAFGIAAADHAASCFSSDCAAGSAESVYTRAVRAGTFAGTERSGAYRSSTATTRLASR